MTWFVGDRAMADGHVVKILSRGGISTVAVVQREFDGRIMLLRTAALSSVVIPLYPACSMLHGMNLERCGKPAVKRIEGTSTRVCADCLPLVKHMPRTMMKTVRRQRRHG